MGGRVDGAGDPVAKRVDGRGLTSGRAGGWTDERAGQRAGGWNILTYCKWLLVKIPRPDGFGVKRELNSF